jgi:hypothetical protein
VLLGCVQLLAACTPSGAAPSASDDVPTPPVAAVTRAPSASPAGTPGPSSSPSALTSPVPSPSPALSPPVVRASVSPPSTIDATGVADATRSLQRFIDATPDHSTITFPDGAIYRVSGTLLLKRRVDLEFVGAATFTARYRSNDPNRSMWRLQGSQTIAFRGFRTIGAHPRPGTYVANFEWQHAFDIQGGSSIEIDHVTMSKAMGDCVYVTDWGGAWARSIWVHDSVCHASGRHGVAVVAGRDIVVERTRFSRIPYVTLDLEPNARRAGELVQGASDVIFQDNRVTDTHNQLFSAGGHGPISRVIVRRNDVRGATYGLWSAVVPKDWRRRRDFVFEDNIADRPWRGGNGAALRFDKVDHLTVRGNVQPFTILQRMLFARVTRSCSVTVSGNDVPGAMRQASISAYSCP